MRLERGERARCRVSCRRSEMLMSVSVSSETPTSSALLNAMSSCVARARSWSTAQRSAGVTVVALDAFGGSARACSRPWLVVVRCASRRRWRLPDAGVLGLQTTSEASRGPPDGLSRLGGPARGPKVHRTTEEALARPPRRFEPPREASAGPDRRFQPPDRPSPRPSRSVRTASEALAGPLAPVRTAARASSGASRWFSGPRGPSTVPSRWFGAPSRPPWGAAR